MYAVQLATMEIIVELLDASEVSIKFTTVTNHNRVPTKKDFYVFLPGTNQGICKKMLQNRNKSGNLIGSREKAANLL